MHRYNLRKGPVNQPHRYLHLPERRREIVAPVDDLPDMADEQKQPIVHGDEEQGENPPLGNSVGEEGELGPPQLEGDQPQDGQEVDNEEDEIPNRDNPQRLLLYEKLVMFKGKLAQAKHLSGLRNSLRAAKSTG